jgi:hypothetical protein
VRKQDEEATGTVVCCLTCVLPVFACRYELPDEELKGRLELKIFDNVGKGVSGHHNHTAEQGGLLVHVLQLRLTCGMLAGGLCGRCAPMVHDVIQYAHNHVFGRTCCSTGHVHDCPPYDSTIHPCLLRSLSVFTGGLQLGVER